MTDGRNNQHDFVYSCECGLTLKASGLRDTKSFKQLKETLTNIIQTQHIDAGHQEVSCQEAGKIRWYYHRHYKLLRL